MRRFWFIFLIFSTSNFFSQITKSDFEAIFLEFPFEKIETIVVNNVRYHNDDGTSKLTYFTYKTSAAKYEIKNNYKNLSLVILSAKKISNLNILFVK